MSTTFEIEEAVALVKRALAKTSGVGLRKAGDLIGVSHTWVGEMRQWEKDGADPEALRDLKPDTVEKVARYVALADDIERRRDALTLAAERLDKLANQMRREATSPRAGIDELLDGADHIERLLAEQKKVGEKDIQE